MNIQIGNDAYLIAQAQQIRHSVFVIEQGIPQALDDDGFDSDALHALVTSHGEAIATARLVIDEYQQAVLARVAVVKAYRGLGIAAKVVQALLTHADKLGVTHTEVHAHEYLQHYYQQFGFRYVAPVEIVGDHQLIEMVRPHATMDAE
ncbi:GNAT family N-acetyltransferase [Vibrio nitrifigilis]|uniref:GNAT family N-acetyltransferase n=1 Tax=Vibrio nitrifigilis TaxID=2789781 RepID=A0ABS0GDN4_9VIBR|nr:GNAT family N-acetyltransferase [Vibrio nitrifigilis]MBF9000527.1 GNAT family N-acetyltransferase [Vibrio nitrifigilis]